uniref:VWFA domain-containing protein n=1 Tax=Salmo trutta TaxID=8032 RepID=A0A673ZK65_SALTR
CAQGLAADIYFLVDSSWSMGQENFEHVRQFLYSVVKALHEGGGGRFQFALIQYSGSPKTEFQLNTYSSPLGALAHIRAMAYRGGGTRTGLGLDFLIRAHLNAAAGSRAGMGVAQAVVILTDGRSQDDVAEPAQVLRLAGVSMFAVGVQDAVDWELREMASVPQDVHIFSVDSFQSLRGIIQDLEPGEWCSLSSFLAAVVGGERDVAFLIDGSDNVRADFPYIRDFIIKVIEPLDIGQDRVRISVVQHSERPAPNFYLNTYKDKAEVLRAVNDLRLSGGRSLNTGMALKFMKDTILSPVHGSRAAQNVPQFLIVLTGGKSKDSVKESAGALKTDGVVPFGVGVGDANFRELEMISFQPGFTFQVAEFSELPSIHPQLVATLKRLSKDTEEAVAPVTHGIPDLVGKNFSLDMSMLNTRNIPYSLSLEQC